VSLAPLVPTPRVAKRLLNVYRLLRASAAGRVRLVDPSTGDYRAVLLLLALVVGRPELADTVLDSLARTTEPTWDDFVRSLLPSTNGERPPPVIGLDADSRAALRQALALSAAPTPSSIATFRDWAEDVRRFHVALR
jgi:hypothetical protein